jgi:hypothetical protein
MFARGIAAAASLVGIGIALFSAGVSAQPAITADAAFGTVRLEPATRASYGIQAAIEGGNSLLAGKFLNGEGDSFTYLRAAERVGKCRTEILEGIACHMK